jgi:hypothetical protein
MLAIPAGVFAHGAGDDLAGFDWLIERRYDPST